MLLHLSPRYYARYTDVAVDLIDVSVPELNLVLKGGKDVVTREFIDNELTAFVFSIDFGVEGNEETSGACPEPLDGECGCAGAPDIRYHQGRNVYVCLACHKQTEPLTRVDFDDFLPMEDE